MTELVAKEIYQRNLDAVSRILVEARWHEIRDHLGLPNTITLADGTVHVDTPEMLLAMLRQLNTALRGMGMTHYVRICIEARFTNPDAAEIEGVHETHVLAGGMRLLPSYFNKMQMKKEPDGSWRAYSMSSTARDRDLNALNAVRQHASRATGAPPNTDNKPG